MAVELGQKTVEFSEVVRRTTEDSFLALRELVERSKAAEDQSDSQKKIDLLKYIFKTRQRMLRLHVLAKWCQQVPLVQYCQQLAGVLSSHDTCFTQAADSLFFTHEGLQQSRAPVYDVPSAIEVLLTGNYRRLPKCIEDLGLQATLTDDEKKPVLKNLDTLLRSKLLEAHIPKEISETAVSEGTVMLRVDGEFKVLLTLGYRGHLSLWRILHLELLVGERSGPVKLEELRRYALGDELERRMASAENPFTILYSILHELCVSLIMDTVIKQVQLLRLGRWKDAIRFELISDGEGGELDSASQKTPGLKIVYWLEFEKTAGGVDSGLSPFIKIEPGLDLQIRCVHSVFVIDPISEREAEFSLDQSCIDIEGLLLRAIACNKHTRLLEIQRDAIKIPQLFRVEGDVLIKGHGDVVLQDLEKEGSGDEVLCVRAYASIYITLGINIRTGRFLLWSSENIIVPSALSDCEEALNQGNMTAVEVFISLRSKSVLHLFASAGKFLGLKVYEGDLATLKIPRSIVNGSDIVLMEFSQCGSCYYLLLHLDWDLRPLFKLLETHTNSNGDSHPVECKHVARFSNIDIGHIRVVQDELNLSLLNWEKIQSSLPTIGDSKQNSNFSLLSDVSSEDILAYKGSSPPSFSSIVDQVFDMEKGVCEHRHPIQIGSVQGTRAGLSSPKWGGSQYSSSGGSAISSVVYQTNNLKGLAQSGPINIVRTAHPTRLPSSHANQDLSSVKANLQPRSSGLYYSSSHDQERQQNGLPKEGSLDAVGHQPAQPLSSTISPSASQLSVGSTKLTGVKSSFTGASTGDERFRKRLPADMETVVPSLQEFYADLGLRKKRKIGDSISHPSASQLLTKSKPAGHTYGSILSQSNHGLSPHNLFISALLHVVRHCSLCIKHAQVTSQMDALEIPYVEEVSLQTPSSNLWFRLPFARDDSWEHICLCLGKLGTMSWQVKVNDPYFKELWELQKGSTITGWGGGVRIANVSDSDSHICFDPEGVVLNYETVEVDSIKRLVSDLQRLSNARLFARGMRNLLGVRSSDEKAEDGSESKQLSSVKGSSDIGDKMLEQMKRVFKIEAVGLMSLWFCYGTMPVMVQFVVEWEAGKEGCTMHVSPDQLWPHTKFLEDFVNGGEVALFLDCIRLTAGPLLALANAIRPARMPGPVASPSSLSPILKQTSTNQATPSSAPPVSNHGLHSTAAPILSSVPGRGGPGIVPSSLLPFDVAVVLRGPYYIRIIYRKKFAVDMRCFAGDQVWLQPATPPKGGAAAGGSLPCPQFRPFIMEHVAQGLNALEPSFSVTGPSQSLVPGVNRVSSGRPGPSQGSGGVGGPSRVGSSALTSAAMGPGLPFRVSPMQLRGEMNTAFIGLGDDGGYGGSWVPLAALKKVLRGILKYLGVLWLFAQLPELLKDILGSIFKENEGGILNLDQEQPALRFFVGGYVFSVSVHRVQLLLQIISVKRVHHPQQQQQAQQQQPQEELASSEIIEICDYFSRRVASEPYDTSRVSSFITLLTLPISVLREFLKLIAWEKGFFQSGELTPAQRARVELSLENHSISSADGTGAKSKSDIHHDRAHSTVDFGLTFVLDPALIPHINAAGGAAWLPYCVSVRLKYSFGETSIVSLIGMEGSHGGQACWSRLEEWENCKLRVAGAVKFANSNAGGENQGRLRAVAESLQKSLQLRLQQLRDGAPPSSLTS